MSTMRTPNHLSPQLLVQEFLRDEPWRLLAACILLNQTSGKQVKPMIADFFEFFPSARYLLDVEESWVKRIIKPLGFQNIRYKRLVGMSSDWLIGMRPGRDKMYGVGIYAIQSYEIFVRGYLISEPQDKELREYVRWAQEESRRNDIRHPGCGGVQQGLQESEQNAVDKSPESLG